MPRAFGSELTLPYHYFSHQVPITASVYICRSSSCFFVCIKLIVHFRLTTHPSSCVLYVCLQSNPCLVCTQYTYCTQYTLYTTQSIVEPVLSRQAPQSVVLFLSLVLCVCVNKFTFQMLSRNNIFYLIPPPPPSPPHFNPSLSAAISYQTLTAPHQHVCVDVMFPYRIHQY